MSSISQQRRSDVRTSAARVGLFYLAVGAVWILLSDRILAATVPDTELLLRLQTYKGGLFVVVSAALIWWLVRREVKRVHRSEGYLAVLSEQSIAGTYVIRHGRMVFVNQRLAEIFGYPDREAMVGLDVRELIAERDREEILLSIGEREAGIGDVAHQYFTGLRADGSEVQLEAFGRTINWDDGRAVAGLLLDITERRQLEQKLRQAATVDALGSLTGAVAHDFNNFLTGILGNLDLVLGDLQDESHDMRTSLQLVRDSAARAASLTGQLLTFTRGRVFHHRAIDANHHLRKLADFLDSLCEAGQELRLDLEDEIPPIMLDPVALDQLVLNLFVNAKEAIGHRGTITVRTRTSAEEGSTPEVLVEVEDSGPGMSQEVLTRIFEPFFTTKERGTGLGLATVRGIVDEARGHLTVQSEPGHGTTMSAVFPVASAAVRDAPIAVVQGGAPKAMEVSTTVLVVDDDAAVRRVIAAGLKRVGHKVLVASTAEEAERILVGVRFDVDLVLSDVSLADRSGPELIAKMRERRADLPVLFTSGSRLSELASEYRELLESSPFLEKPFSVDELRAAVAGAVHPKKTRSERKSNGA